MDARFVNDRRLLEVDLVPVDELAALLGERPAGAADARPAVRPRVERLHVDDLAYGLDFTLHVCREVGALTR